MKRDWMRGRAPLPLGGVGPCPVTADYGYRDRTARGRSDLGKIARHWPDILRVIASIHTRAISAHEAIRVLQREGRLNALVATLKVRLVAVKPVAISNEQAARNFCGPSRAA